MQPFKTSWCCARCHGQQFTMRQHPVDLAIQLQAMHVELGHCDAIIRGYRTEADLVAAIQQLYPSTAWSERQWLGVLMDDPVMEEMVYNDIWVKGWKEGRIKNDKWRRMKRRAKALNPDAS